MASGIVITDPDYKEAFESCCQIYGEGVAIAMFLEAGLAKEVG